MGGRMDPLALHTPLFRRLTDSVILASDQRALAELVNGFWVPLLIIGDQRAYILDDIEEERECRSAGVISCYDEMEYLGLVGNRLLEQPVEPLTVHCAGIIVYQRSNEIPIVIASSSKHAQLVHLDEILKRLAVEPPSRYTAYAQWRARTAIGGVKGGRSKFGRRSRHPAACEPATGAGWTSGI